jgi:hypothetical protein
MGDRGERTSWLLFLVLLLFAPTASADLIVSWSFDQENIVALPDENLEISATLWNDAASTEILYFTQLAALGGTGAPPGGGLPLDAAYDVSLGWLIALRPIVVNPGESFTFEWVFLEPLSGNAPLGVYGPAEAQLEVPPQSGGTLILDSLNLFTVTVVPEASTGLLLGLGLLGLGIRGRRRQRNPRVAAGARRAGE